MTSRTISVLILLLISINSYGSNFGYGLDKNIETISQEIGKDSLNVRVSENRLIVENLPKDNILEIYNIMGAKVFTRRIKSGTNEYQISLPKGYYIIKIGKFTKKIAIR